MCASDSGAEADFGLSERLGFMSERRDDARNASEARNHGGPRYAAKFGPAQQIHSTLPGHSYLRRSCIFLGEGGDQIGLHTMRSIAPRAFQRHSPTCKVANTRRESESRIRSKKVLRNMKYSRPVALRAADRRGASQSCFAARDEKL